MTNWINWFEIPVNDISRAKAFYEKVFETKLEDMEMPDMKGAMFHGDGKGVHGAIIQTEGWVPSDKGSVIYLNGGDDLGVFMSRVEGAGGRIVKDKFSIGEHGFIGFFEDTEGNRIGLHSNG